MQLRAWFLEKDPITLSVQVIVDVVSSDKSDDHDALAKQCR